MRQFIFFIWICVFCGSTYSQSETVRIYEEKRGKRLFIMAENTSADTLNVFLRILSEGYRRSADKPILKNLLPFSKTEMTMLIELKDVPSSYTYDLIVNDGLNNEIDLSYESSVVDITPQLENKIVIFTINDCEKCNLLNSLLLAQRIPHQSFNIQQDDVLYQQFMKFIGEPTEDNEKIRFPVIWNKDHALFGYDDLEALLKTFK